MAEYIGSFTPEERTALLAKAEAARARAAELIAKSLVLQAHAVEQRETTAAAIHDSALLREELCSVIAQHARVARALGESPERVVLQIKSASADAVAAAYSQSTSILPLHERLLREDLVSWTIQAYFGASL